MTLRTMLGMGWSLLTGLAGGWLVLMPWALNVQGGGDWTTVTKVSFGTGLGLLVFCLVGLLATSLPIARMVAPPRRARAAEAAPQERADQESLDRALLQLATKLVADLEAPGSEQARPAPFEPATTSNPTSPAETPVPNGGSVRPQAPSSVSGGSAQGEPTSTSGGAPTWRRVDQ